MTVGSDSIDLAKFEKTIGEADELPAKDRARLRLAGWILVCLFVLTLVSAVLLIWAPADRTTQAAEFFSYIKAAVPPLVTLVIGFYFQAQSNSD